MARRKVVTVPMMEVKRNFPKSEFLGWGTRQVRKVTAEAESPRLLAYRTCIARHLKNKTFDNLEAVQKKFKETAPECAKEAAKKKTIWKRGRAPKGFKHKY